jgi:hypoxanthine phosphoribosyltransferase
VLIPRQSIAETIARLASTIRQDYYDSPPVCVAVLKGSFMFLADLVRALAMPVLIDFVRLASYGSATASSGRVEVRLDVHLDIAGKDVLIIEDIVDSGHTVRFLLDYLAPRGPTSIRLCALLDKPERRQVPVTIDYCGFSVPDVFIVGYGIDWNEQYRYLPDICCLKEDESGLPGPH